MDISETIKLLHNLIKKQINKEVESLGITCDQSKMLIFILLNKNRELNQREIEQTFNLSNPTVNGILNRLEKKGLIKRVISNQDKRVKNIIPLKKAEEFEKKLESLKNNTEHAMLKNINLEDLNIFYSVLETIKNNLKEKLNERNI